MEFDFLDHVLVLRTTDGDRRHGRPAAVLGRRLLRRDDGRAGRRWACGSTSCARPVEVPVSIPFADDARPRQYDRDAVHRFWLALVQVRPRAGRVPGPVRRQGQPGPLLLGRLRPGDDPVLGPDGPAAPGRRPQLRRLGDARGVQPRGQQLRLLAGAAARRARSTPTPTPSPTASPPARSTPRPVPATTRASASSSCPTRSVRTAPDPDAVVLRSSRRPTRPPPTWPTGTARPWSGRDHPPRPAGTNRWCGPLLRVRCTSDRLAVRSEPAEAQGASMHVPDGFFNAATSVGAGVVVGGHHRRRPAQGGRRPHRPAGADGRAGGGVHLRRPDAELPGGQRHQRPPARRRAGRGARRPVGRPRCASRSCCWCRPCCSPTAG